MENARREVNERRQQTTSQIRVLEGTVEISMKFLKSRARYAVVYQKTLKPTNSQTCNWSTTKSEMTFAGQHLTVNPMWDTKMGRERQRKGSLCTRGKFKLAEWTLQHVPRLASTQCNLGAWTFFSYPLFSFSVLFLYHSHQLCKWRMCSHVHRLKHIYKYGHKQSTMCVACARTDVADNVSARVYASIYFAIANRTKARTFVDVLVVPFFFLMTRFGNCGPVWLAVCLLPGDTDTTDVLSSFTPTVIIRPLFKQENFLY